MGPGLALSRNSGGSRAANADGAPRKHALSIAAGGRKRKAPTADDPSCVVPAEAGTHRARSFVLGGVGRSFFTCRPGVMGPGLRRDDALNVTCLRDLAAHFARGLLPIFLALQTEGAGKTGCALHPRSRVQLHKRVRTRAYRSSGEHPAFPAQWLYGLYVISPVRRALLPPSLRR